MSSFQFIDQEMEKTFYMTRTDKVIIGYFKDDKFIYKFEKNTTEWIGSTSKILRGLDNGSIIQLN